jgi:hypothetical protein
VKLDQRGSAVLGEDACWRHLAREAAASGVGRVAVNGERSPHVIPVNFKVVDRGIVIRLGPGWAAFHLDGSAATFEADQAEAIQHSGWSVVVEGVAHVVTYDDIARLGANLPTPMVTAPGVRVFEIVPFKITGRAVEPDLRDEPRDFATDIPEEKGTQTSNLRLTPDGADELATVLQSAHWDVNSKIANTDDPVLREMLLERRRLLVGLAAQLSGAGTT